MIDIKIKIYQNALLTSLTVPMFLLFCLLVDVRSKNICYKFLIGDKNLQVVCKFGISLVIIVSTVMSWLFMILIIFIRKIIHKPSREVSSEKSHPGGTVANHFTQCSFLPASIWLLVKIQNGNMQEFRVALSTAFGRTSFVIMILGNLARLSITLRHQKTKLRQYRLNSS
ncbi:hypothetical protein BY996DRAFT_3804711 [Phakopsora pachyrhizi]|nr:hypothetical protein BY996DRAFT_3804711 [Phakopsora pachyrhizi]